MFGGHNAYCRSSESRDRSGEQLLKLEDKKKNKTQVARTLRESKSGVEDWKRSRRCDAFACAEQTGELEGRGAVERRAGCRAGTWGWPSLPISSNSNSVFGWRGVLTWEW